MASACQRCWHLYQIGIMIYGRKHWLWRAEDDMIGYFLVQRQRCIRT